MLTVPAPLPAQSQFDKMFNRVEIETSDLFNDLFTYDLDGDGKEDLLVVLDAKEGKRLAIYFQKDNSFALKPDQLVTFDKQAILFVPADISSIHKGRELVFLTRNSLQFYYLKNRRYQKEAEKLTELSSVFMAPSKECPVRSSFVWERGDQKSPLVIIPGADSMTIFKKNKAGGLVESQKLAIAPSFTISSYERRLRSDGDGETFSQKTVMRVPRIYLKDFNGDKQDDIVSIVNDRVEVFFNKGDDVFSSKADFHTKLVLLTENEKEAMFTPNTAKNVCDLNGDGLVDIVVTKIIFKTGAGFTKIYIYLNKKGKINSAPDQVIMKDNCLNIPQMRDMNNDGLLDFIIPEAKIGLLQIFKILMTKKLSYRRSIYLNRDNTFAEKPDLSLKVEARFDLDNPQNMEGEFLYVSGDFNGDTVKDLLRTESKSGKLLIFHGLPKSKQFFSSSAAFQTKEKQMPRDCIIKDLNGDKKSDIIFDYRQNKKKKIVVFVSK